MESISIYLLTAFAVVIIALNLIATFVIYHTYFEVKNRRLYQIWFVWLVPIIGALLAIYINKEDYFAQKHATQIGNNPNISESQAVHMGSAANHHGER